MWSLMCLQQNMVSIIHCKSKGLHICLLFCWQVSSMSCVSTACADLLSNVSYQMSLAMERCLLTVHLLPQVHCQPDPRSVQDTAGRACEVGPAQQGTRGWDFFFSRQSPYRGPVHRLQWSRWTWLAPDSHGADSLRRRQRGHGSGEPPSAHDFSIDREFITTDEGLTGGSDYSQNACCAPLDSESTKACWPFTWRVLTITSASLRR